MFRYAVVSVLLMIPALSLAQPDGATARAWVMSIPHANSASSLYKVRINSIDGVRQTDAVRYPIRPGLHELVVELMLDIEWEPDLSAAPTGPSVKQITIDAEAGKSYRIGARVDREAPAESQLDQSFWQVVVFDQP
jgi:hypothetical protein